MTHSPSPPPAPTVPLFVHTQGRGPDVVLLHGWGLHGGVWARIADHLATDFTVHSVDLPGHGASAHPEDYTLDALAAILAAAFPLPVQVVGWSLGGLIAMHWAHRTPQQVKSLSLVASSPCFVQQADWAHAQPTAVMRQFATNLDGAFEHTLQRFLALQLIGSDSARSVLADLKAQLFAHGRPSALAQALAILEGSDLRPHVAAITQPVALLYGQRDLLTPPEVAHWLADTLPDARLTVFPTASHAPFLSHEADFLATLRPFLHECA